MVVYTFKIYMICNFNIPNYTPSNTKNTPTYNMFTRYIYICVPSNSFPILIDKFLMFQIVYY